MSLSVSDANRLFTSVVVNVCFLAIIIVMLIIIYRLSLSTDQHAVDALKNLLPKAGGCGVLLSACITVQLGLLKGPKK